MSQHSTEHAQTVANMLDIATKSETRERSKPQDSAVVLSCANVKTFKPSQGSRFVGFANCAPSCYTMGDNLSLVSFFEAKFFAKIICEIRK